MKKGAGRKGNRRIAHTLVSGTVGLHIESAQLRGAVSASANMALDNSVRGSVNAAEVHSGSASKAKRLVEIFDAVGNAPVIADVHSRPTCFPTRTRAPPPQALPLPQQRDWMMPATPPPLGAAIRHRSIASLL